MNITGIIVGLATFLTIGLFHPLVIRAEYHLGVRCWPLFALAGVGSCLASAFLSNFIASTILGVVGFSCFWSIHELFQQRRRVEKGWFPANPKRKAHDKD